MHNLLALDKIVVWKVVLTNDFERAFDVKKKTDQVDLLLET